MFKPEMSTPSAGAGWLPIEGLPVGLVTWYTSGGAVATVLASWLAVVNGCPPVLLAGCPTSGAGGEGLPAGCDFAVNVPGETGCPCLHELLQAAGDGPVMISDRLPLAPARSVRAPLLAGCALQIECAHGRSLPGDWEPEFAGDIVLLHRGGLFVDPADHADFCALGPLRAMLAS